MLGRRGDFFRLSKLHYPEIENKNAAVDELQSLSLVDKDNSFDLESLLPLYTKTELAQIFKLKPASVSRSELINQIAVDMSDEKLRRLQEKDGHIKLLQRTEFDIFKLCFFGNMYQDLSEFVLRDLGMYTYENYQITKSSRAFSNREQIDAQMQYFQCSVEFDEIEKSNSEALLQLDKIIPATIFNESDPHLVRRIERLRNRIARQLERNGSNPAAFTLYSKTNRPPSRERRVRILTKLEQFQDALELCQQMAESPNTDEETQFTELFLPKLHKLLGMTVSKPPGFRPNTTKLTLKPTEQRVELAAKEFYSQFGSCFYCENTLINGVLGLFIWEIVFAPMPNVFFNPFQSYPSDFYEPSFTKVRHDALVSRMALMDDEMTFTAEVWNCFEKKHGIANPLVNWSWLDKELLQLALSRIPVGDFKAMFYRILDDLRNNGSGLPDLILFDKSGGYEFIEIKGPGDAVQKNQKRWMQFFYRNRIPYRVVNVRWSSTEN